ncbi:MAG TPA: hypothetical protein PLF25_00620, partial [Accumulibacter sp.]|nr:hypothetical protein [Accumulibacter sp.]
MTSPGQPTLSGVCSPAVFRHAEVLLAELLRSPYPADKVVAGYFRQHRQHGQRNGPVLVLGREHEEHDDQAE